MGHIVVNHKRRQVPGPESTVEYYVIPQGRIAEADHQARRAGIWEAFEGRRYITCLGCGLINDISHQEVTTDGFLVDTIGTSMGCVICWKCDTHFFVKLEGWAPIENKGR